MRIIVKTLFLLFLLPYPLCFGEISVIPVVLSIKPHEHFTKVEVSNSGTIERHFHAQLKSWSQVDGKDTYEDVNDWTISPAIFSIAPTKTQLIRLGPKQKKIDHKEQSFRLFLEEIPLQGGGEKGKIKMIFNISLPVFLETEQKTNEKPHIQINGTTLTITNPTAHHISLGLLKNGSKEISLPGYILPGQTRTFPNLKYSLSSEWTLTYGYLGDVHHLNLGAYTSPR